MRCENFKANASSAGECPISRRVPDEKPHQLAAVMRNLKTNEKHAPPSASSAVAQISSDSTAREEGRNKIAGPLAEITGLDKCTAAAMGDERTQRSDRASPASTANTRAFNQPRWSNHMAVRYIFSIDSLTENQRKCKQLQEYRKFEDDNALLGTLCGKQRAIHG
jgi:hypothetical protein